MNYLIEFKYERVRGQTLTSKVYAETEGEADLIVEDHLGDETRPHRFDRLYERNPKEWEFWMNGCCVDDEGIRYGWGRVLDYIGIPWRDPSHWWLNPNGEEIVGQSTIFDYLEVDA